MKKKNEEDFYSKVIELYQNKEKAQELGNNGKEFIEKKILLGSYFSSFS